ncbi:hypothetical protein FHG87_003866 [Trinorchestia longiramus]|nr:hypothetical protein FHG87_003866 [Trinorchestia longiramus]
MYRRGRCGSMWCRCGDRRCWGSWRYGDGRCWGSWRYGDRRCWGSWRYGDRRCWGSWRYGDRSRSLIVSTRLGIFVTPIVTINLSVTVLSLLK